MKNKYIGSNFDEFLQEEGLLAETEAVAIKRVIAHQINREMAELHISMRPEGGPCNYAFLFFTFTQAPSHQGTMLLT